MQCRLLPLLVAFVLAIAGAARADPGHRPGDAHDVEEQQVRHGVLGDTSMASRVVHVTMRDAPGRMMFQPDRIEVRQGEQIRFILRNDGTVDHAFVVAIREENRRHAEEMKLNPRMIHDPRNARRVGSRKTGDLLWRFTEAGEFDFSCLIAGHRDAGMFGTIVVN